MAANNNSSNSVFLSDLRKDLDIFSIIVKFDQMRDRPTKEEFIREFKESADESYREVGYFLEDRYMEPPDPLPDNSILYVDVVAMDRAHLKAWAHDARFLIALRYDTHL